MMHKSGKSRLLKIRFYANILNILSSSYFQYFVLFLILSSIFSVMLSSFTEFTDYSNQLSSFTYFSSIIFTIEYILRFISAPLSYRSKSHFRSRLKYMFSFYGLVDFVAILPFVVINLSNDSPVFHYIMLARIFNMFKLIRYSKGLKMMAKIFNIVRSELLATFTACGIIILFSSILIYYIERGAQPEAYKNIGDGLWWSIVTFTTIGYGDIVPVTILGRILAGFMGITGILTIAIPAGLISSAFQNVLQENKKIKEDLALKKLELKAKKGADSSPAVKSPTIKDNTELDDNTKGDSRN